MLLNSPSYSVYSFLANLANTVSANQNFDLLPHFICLSLNVSIIPAFLLLPCFSKVIMVC